MRITGVLAALVVVGGFAVGLASPAHARPVPEPMYGVYTYHQDGAPDETWSMWPTCVQAGCTLHMTSVVSPHLGPVSDFPPYNGDANKVNGLWTWLVPKEKGAKCADGSWASTGHDEGAVHADLQGAAADTRHLGPAEPDRQSELS